MWFAKKMECRQASFHRNRFETGMSALHPKAAAAVAERRVRFGPRTDI
jgi:hypothetical protein